MAAGREGGWPGGGMPDNKQVTAASIAHKDIAFTLTQDSGMAPLHEPNHDEGVEDRSTLFTF